MRAIFLKELKDSRGFLWILIATSFVLAVVPREFSRSWGGLSTFLAVPLLCCYLGSRLLASETEDEQLELLLTVPIPRWQLFAAKFGAGMLMTLAIGLVAILGAAMSDGALLEMKFLTGWGSSIVLMFTLGAFFSLVFPRSQSASFAAFLVFAVGLLTEEAMMRSMGQRTAWPRMAVMAMACIALATAATAWTFCTADLTDARDCRRSALRAGLQSALAAALFLAYYLSMAR